METLKDKLRHHDHVISSVILSRQDPVTGLFPASTAVTQHGDYRDAWVRDNVYSVLAVWGLAQAYRQLEHDDGRTYELEHCVVKLMRGLLASMMRQAHKVELFKNSQNPAHSIHAKFNATTGMAVVGDHEWGHLQLDATSIYLFYLAQMTTAGLHIIYTIEEVHFVQNLVYYIERAYRTPDYGIWERGNKCNHGQPELNCSSIGMATAALQAINGVDLFGGRGGGSRSSIIHVLPDELARNNTTLHSFLPRESNSKEIDAALLSVVGFPAYAVEKESLSKKTMQEIVSKLQGTYGCKRFLRDGHQTVLEDSHRLHYEPYELKVFEHIECEWPLFFCYMLLDAHMRYDAEMIAEYQAKLQPLLVPRRIDEDTVVKLVPELYIVSRSKVEAEKSKPHSQIREPNANIPLIWAQSLYQLSCLMSDSLISPSHIDPLGRRLRLKKLTMGMLHSRTIVQVVLLSEDSRLQAILRTFGIETQTPEEVAPVRVRSPEILRKIYALLGKDEKLALSGRPDRPIGSLGTCKLYRIDSDLYAFTPSFMQATGFYLTQDNDILARMVENELRFVSSNWRLVGRPTMCMMLTHTMFSVTRATTETLSLITSLKSGECNGVPVRLGALSPLVGTSCIENLQFVYSSSKAELANVRRILNEMPSLPSEATVAAAAASPLGSAGLRADKRRLRMSVYDDVMPMLAEIEELLELAVPPLGVCGVDWRWSSILKVVDMEFKFDCDAACELLKEPGGLKEQANLVEALAKICRLTIEQYGAMSQTAATFMEHTPPSRAASSALPSGSHSGGVAAAAKGGSSGEGASEGGACIEMDRARREYMRLSSRPKPSERVKQRAVAAITSLAEMLYTRACHVKNWSVVRMAASLAHKSADSLTSALVELLIHQKQVTIGGESGEEHLFSTPLTPAELNERIYRYGGRNDSRAVPLVMELLLNLESLIKADPKLFDGIMRIRMHFLMQALATELARLRRQACDMEQLYECSPAQVKALLHRVLAAHPRRNGNGSGSHSNNELSGSTNEQRPALSYASALLASIGATSEVVAIVQSAGFHDGNFARIEVGDVVVAPNQRGLNCVIVDPDTGKVVDVRCFDTDISEDEANEFASFIEHLPNGSYALLSVRDDAAKHMNEAAIRAAESLGSCKVRELSFRDSWCLIGKKGNAPGTSPENLTPSRMGASAALRQRLVLRSTLLDDVLTENTDDERAARASSAPSVAGESNVPASGAWFRRRQLDGALNRVPQDFYIYVWHILEWSAMGLAVCGKNLARSPTVEEKTPEEWNFAIEVESLLDAVPSPAERSAAVSCLMNIRDFIIRDESKRERRQQADYIRIDQLIHDAVHSFWRSLSSPSSSASSLSSVATPASVSVSATAPAGSAVSPTTSISATASGTVSASTSPNASATTSPQVFDFESAKQVFLDQPNTVLDHYLHHAIVRMLA